MTADITITVSVRIGLVGCVRKSSFKMDLEEWDSLDLEKQERACMDHILEHVMGWGWEEEA